MTYATEVSQAVSIILGPKQDRILMCIGTLVNDSCAQDDSEEGCDDEESSNSGSEEDEEDLV